MAFAMCRQAEFIRYLWLESEINSSFAPNHSHKCLSLKFSFVFSVRNFKTSMAGEQRFD